jgi:hypothetical protein
VAFDYNYNIMGIHQLISAIALGAPSQDLRHRAVFTFE